MTCAVFQTVVESSTLVFDRKIGTPLSHAMCGTAILDNATHDAWKQPAWPVSGAHGDATCKKLDESICR